MKSPVEKLVHKIKTGSRSIADSSLKVYLNQLKLICTALHGRGYAGDEDFYDYESILEHLALKTPSVARARLSAILVALSPRKRIVPRKAKAKKAYEAYSIRLKELVNERTRIEETQTMSERHKRNWTTMANLKAVQKELEMEAYALLDDVRNVKQSYGETFFKIQDYVICSLYTLDHAPRRNEYADVRIISYVDYYEKISSEEKARYNWLVYREKNGKKQTLTFIFNNFKTMKKFGSQVIAVAPELCKVLLLWLEVNKSPWLLLNKQMAKLSRSYLSQLIPRIFSKCGHIGSSLIRHIYVSEFFEGDSTYLEKKKLSQSMGHSISSQQVQYRYVK